MRRINEARLAVQLLALGHKAEAEAMINRLDIAGLIEFDALYEAWLHEGQRVPEGQGWRTWLMQAGRGLWQDPRGCRMGSWTGDGAALPDRAGRGDA